VETERIVKLIHQMERDISDRGPDSFGGRAMSVFADLFGMLAIVDFRAVSTYANIMLVRNVRDLGAAVRDARLRCGWTQAELADRIHVSRQWVIALERGKTTAELGIALRAVVALGLIVDLVQAPVSESGIDLDRLLGEHL
jgi:HTH-type transcriptional regulator / antitoxin HipB